MDRYLAEARVVLARYQYQTIHSRPALWFLERLLRWAGRGGQRFGSRQAYVQYAEERGQWIYHYRYCI
jgi:hypothetical protein